MNSLWFTPWTPRSELTLCISWVFASGALIGCSSPTETSTPKHGTMRPQSVVLLVTPKLFPDFAKPEATIERFFDNYKALASKAQEVIVVFAVGSGDHILNYRGVANWKDSVEWARTTNGIPTSDRTLDYYAIDRIVRSFKAVAVTASTTVEVFDLMDSGGEFTVGHNFKYVLHPECTINKWGMFDVGGRLRADNIPYASAPNGIAEGTLCGDFLADQVGQYMNDLGFDGVLYGNQLGTRGRWTAGDGPGYSVEEANGIRAFLDHSRRVFGTKGVIWSDSYNNTEVERSTFSFPADGYSYFDYIVASGFCVIPPTKRDQYLDDLNSKLQIKSGPRILASLDYVDPWYSYNSMTDYTVCSTQLEKIAIDSRYDIDGLWLIANDEVGELIPRKIIESFAARFFSTPQN